jgi:hypothetical protein
MMRQIGEQILTIAAMLGCTLALALGAHAESLVTTIVSDPLTGVAIDGYDAVSYFTDPDPRLGKADFVYDWQGVPWYFESAANRDVFIRNPTIYAPQFGGHCLMSLSRGYLSDGKPRLYVIEAMRLYFFYSTANRDAFLLAKGPAIDAAAKNWPELEKQLTGGTTNAAASEAVASMGGEAPTSDSSQTAASDPSAASVAPSSAADNLSSN